MCLLSNFTLGKPLSQGLPRRTRVRSRRELRRFSSPAALRLHLGQRPPPPSRRDGSDPPCTYRSRTRNTGNSNSWCICPPWRQCDPAPRRSPWPSHPGATSAIPEPACAGSCTPVSLAPCRPPGPRAHPGPDSLLPRSAHTSHDRRLERSSSTGPPLFPSLCAPAHPASGKVCAEPRQAPARALSAARSWGASAQRHVRRGGCLKTTQNVSRWNCVAMGRHIVGLPPRRKTCALPARDRV